MNTGIFTWNLRNINVNYLFIYFIHFYLFLFMIGPSYLFCAHSDLSFLLSFSFLVGKIICFVLTIALEFVNC